MLRITRQFFILLSLGLTLIGCAGITYHAEPPQISISNIQLVDAQLLEQRYDLTLRVQNTNDFPFFIKGISYKLDINGSEFAHGVSKQSLDILPYEEQFLTVTLVSNTLGLIKQFQTLSTNNPMPILNIHSIAFVLPCVSTPLA
ncbi:MAG TPA: Water stress and hypersensitive response domain-containing protein [Cycloclasticus sp.]|jgi:LEA14-like dessication related protein|nr:Water stress and hypersensitive response domain-containing protein [Cycloclasticus sp.]